jgi:hypothetical protein
LRLCHCRFRSLFFRARATQFRARDVNRGLRLGTRPGVEKCRHLGLHTSDDISAAYTVTRLQLDPQNPARYRCRHDKTIADARPTVFLDGHDERSARDGRYIDVDRCRPQSKCEQAPCRAEKGQNAPIDE